MSADRALRIQVQGIVQGVGYRPFVYGAAQELALRGWVRNTDSGVEIAVDGPAAALEQFVTRLRREAPPLAHIDRVQVRECEPNGYPGFKITSSPPDRIGLQPVAPDMSICPDCLTELFDPADRRYRYPFINCTNCGPRFTIISDLPYDRPATTMAEFEMCAECAAEYRDPLNRRFHAQPVACPACGPQIWLEPGGQRGEAALQATRRLLGRGKVVAIKGLGGFHLACDATSSQAVRLLRERKQRSAKPFAVMMPDIACIEQHCRISPQERALLESRERPIVVLEKRPGSRVVEAVAPGQQSLGVMLPYTPLHLLLLERERGMPEVLVMTSGNLSDHPLVADNQTAADQLAPLTDAFLFHDRKVEIRCDDSVVRCYEQPGQPQRIYPLRRARGYAPFPVQLPWQMPATLGAGSELKNAFCLTRDQYAFLSQHIGDLENYETLQVYRRGISHFERLFRVKLEVLAYDLHPDYLATRYALERAASDGLVAIGVQHHHAHVAACMAEYRLPADRPVIGVAFDGSGYGADGTIWGGEFLLASYAGFERLHWLRPVPLPGGEAAIRHPWRQALAWLQTVGQPWAEELPCVRAVSERQLSVLRSQLDQRINAPLTSSAGRLFDAIASLLGVRQSVSYEAQAAIELEALVDLQEQGAYRFDSDGPVIDPAPVIDALLQDRRTLQPIERIAARFHNAVAQMVGQVCLAIRRQHAVEVVVLSGGVWQNLILLRTTVRLLEQAGFSVCVHRQVPTNDGGLALGQVAVACHNL